MENEHNIESVAAAEARMTAAHENWQHLRFTTGKAWTVYVELRDQWLEEVQAAKVSRIDG